MISILPNFVLNSNLHSLRARQTRVRLKSLLSWTSNIFLKPRPFPSHLMEYHGRIKKWFESLNNTPGVLNNACHTLQISFQEDLSFFVYAFAIWEAQAIHNPAATMARSISKCRSHANLRVTWEINSWNLRFPYMNLQCRCFGIALYNGKIRTFLARMLQAEASMNLGKWRIKGQTSNDHYDYARNNLVSLGDFDSSVDHDCCLYDCYLLSLSCHDNAMTIIVILIDYLDVEYRTVFRNELQWAFWS